MALLSRSQTPYCPQKTGRRCRASSRGSCEWRVGYLQPSLTLTLPVPIHLEGNSIGTSSDLRDLQTSPRDRSASHQQGSTPEAKTLVQLKQGPDPARPGHILWPLMAYLGVRHPPQRRLGMVAEGSSLAFQAVQYMRRMYDTGGPRILSLARFVRLFRHDVYHHLDLTSLNSLNASCPLSQPCLPYLSHSFPL